jgi:hypothetical protein
MNLGTMEYFIDFLFVVFEEGLYRFVRALRVELIDLI